MQNQKLRKAIWTVLHLRSKRTDFPILCTKKEYYILERTMIEAGLLTGDSKRCAHSAFLQLISQLELTFPEGTPTLSDLSKGSKLIKEHDYPWEPATKNQEIMMPRWRAVYVNFLQLMQEEDMEQGKISL